MKPIKLTLGGLNSFRELQEIDFAALCQGGVFGIFGPTGSGKSTILDAITLALYGSVERASGNTQGILNLTQDRLFVQYTFSLGKGPSRRVYRAERAYKRGNKENSVVAGNCRLVELNGEQETVLAGTSTEITEKIKGILGLSLDDFTRAVVLPQGKFAEFMTLAPSERRNMLERLFGLEEYGKRLTQRVKQEMATTELELTAIVNQLLGLGDASEGKIAQGLAELKRTALEAAQREEVQTQLKTAYEEAKEIWGYQEELRANRDKETALALRQQEITDMEERLGRALRAEPLRPLLLQNAKSEENVKSSELLAVSAEARVQETRCLYQQAEEHWTNARGLRMEKEPELIRRLEQLKQGVVLDGKLQEQRAKNQETLKAQKQRATAKEQHLHQLRQLREKKQSMRESLERDKSRLREIAIAPEERTQVVAAFAALENCEKTSRLLTDKGHELRQAVDQFNGLRVRLGKEQQLLTQAQKSMQAIRQSQQELKGASPVEEEELLKGTQEIERDKGLLQSIRRAEVDLEKARKDAVNIEEQERLAAEMDATLVGEWEASAQRLADGKAAYEKSRQRLERLEAGSVAGSLAEGLRPGEPCPVCGSNHHPTPATHADPAALAAAKVEAEIREKGVQQEQQSYSALETRKAVSQANRQGLRERLEQQKALLATKVEALELDRRQLPGEWQSLASQEVGEAIRRKEAEFLALKGKLSQWKIDLEKKNQELEKGQQELDQRTATESELRAASEGARTLVQQGKNALDQLQEEERRQREVLDSARGDLAVEDIRIRHERQQEWDREGARLGREVAQREADLGVLEGDLGTQEQGLKGIELELAGLEAALQENIRVAEGLEKQLQEITGGGKADELLNATETHLRQITAAEEVAQKKAEASRGSLTTAEQNLALAQKEVGMYRLQREQLQTQVAAALREAGFITLQLAENSLADAKERAAMAEVSENYKKEKAVLRERGETLLRKLEGRRVEPEAMVAWPARVREAEDLYKEALSRREAARFAVEDLEKKRQDWIRLEADRKRVAQRSDQLNQLEKVLRGNAFVEYAAHEQLMNVALAASERLGRLSNRKFALEIDSGGGFVIRDDSNGGSRRPVNTFSGGEKFLASLALALALSTQIQLRGEAPLEFFFLDEGFGTLDKDTLETVMSTLEKLHLQDLAIGIISHVEEIKSRVNRRLVVTPAQPEGSGSRVKLETA